MDFCWPAVAGFGPPRFLAPVIKDAIFFVPLKTFGVSLGPMSYGRDCWSVSVVRLDALAEDCLQDLLLLAQDGTEVEVCGAAFIGPDEATEQSLWEIYTPTEDQRLVLESRLAGAAEQLGLDSPTARPQILGHRLQLREPWHEAWRVHFRPVILPGLVKIVPPWEANSPNEEAPLQIVIDPGMAFGTGTHSTTQLALTLGLNLLPSAREERRKLHLLDVGTGSAILSLAMLLAGTGRVTATDLDREILPNILDNFQLNGLLAEQAPLETLQDQFRLHIGPLTNSVVGPGLNTEFQPPWSGPFDLILCNMLQHEFTPLLGNLAELARPGAAMVLSGWLAKDFDEVQADLTAAGWTMIETIREQQEWGGLVVRRS